MADVRPIGLYQEGTSSQNHDAFHNGDTIDVAYVPLDELISKDAGNVIRIADGKLFVGDCRPKTASGG